MGKKQIPIIALLISSLLLMMPLSVYADTVFYNVTVDNSSRGICDDAGSCGRVIFDGERVTSSSSLIGATFNRVDLKLRALNTDYPAGNIFIGVWDGTIAPTSSNYKRLIAQVDPNTLAFDVITQFNFTMQVEYTFVSGDVIGVLYPTVTNKIITTRFATTDQFNGTSTLETFYSHISGWNDVTTNDITMRIWFQTPTEGGSVTPIAGVNCALPENVNLLICRIGGDGSIANVGAFVVGNTTRGTGLSGISCSVGVVDCATNPNIQTNGLGYLFLAVALSIWVGILWVASRGQITEIPNFVWIIGTIAVVGAVTVVGWIDPTILIVSIIAIIALAGIKSKNIFSGVGGMFKGESA